MELIEKVYPEGGKLVIPYEKYRLKNGLTLVLHEDKSAPVVHVDVTYKVGSANEVPGKSGLAHFFEHMMFQGSKNVAKEGHFKIISEIGGNLNGSTSRDRTNYFQTVPSNGLETVLWLESDRMGLLKEGITYENFENQRDTIINERLQRYDNAPYGLWREHMCKAMYPKSHPYSWMTIGSIKDIKATTIEDFKAFYDQWYGPNNAVLTIGGDFNTQKTLDWVAKYFEPIPARSFPKLELEAVPALAETQYLDYIDSKIHFPGVFFNYPTVKKYHEDEVALNCLADILGKSKTSSLYQFFVQTKKAMQASVIHYASQFSGEFNFVLLPYPQLSLPELEEELKLVLEKAIQEDLNAAALQCFVSGFESQMYKGYDSISQKVSLLAHYSTFAPETNFLEKEIEAHQSLNLEQVKRVFQEYILEENALVLSVLDKKSTLPIAKATSFKNGVGTLQAHNGINKAALLWKDKATFDRAVRPQQGPLPLIQLPSIERSKMGACNFIYLQEDKTPVVHAHLYFQGGRQLDMETNHELGMASLLGLTFLEGNSHQSAAAIAQSLQRYGATINAIVNENQMVVSLFTLSKYLESASAILADCLTHSSIKEEDFLKVKKQQLEAIVAKKKRPSAVADLLFDRLIFPEDTIDTAPNEGTYDAVSSIGIEQLNAAKNRYFNNKIAVIGMSDIASSALKDQLKFCKQLPEFQGAIKKPIVLKQNGFTIHVVDMPGAAQTEIRIGHQVDLQFHPLKEYFLAQLVNYNLGGGFNSRLNHQIREVKGYTYGIRSGFSANERTGKFFINTSVDTPNTGAAVEDILHELDTFVTKGITKEELQFIKNAFLQKEALRFASRSHKALYLKNVMRFNLDEQYPSIQKQIIEDLHQQAILDFSQQYLKMDHMQVVLAGDAEQIKQQTFLKDKDFVLHDVSTL